MADEDLRGELAAINSRLDTLSGQIDDLFRLAVERVNTAEAETDARFRRDPGAYPGHPGGDSPDQFAGRYATAFGGVAGAVRRGSGVAAGEYAA